MARLHQLICLLLSVSAGPVISLLHHFVPPDAILQAGFPAGFRAFIPDFPGCQRFSFRAKLISPFAGGKVGTWAKDILRPRDGFWTFEDMNTVLTPGDVLQYTTLIVKDNVPYPRTNLTWIVPEPNDADNFVTPPSTKAPKPPNPMKMVDSEEVTSENEEPTEETAPPAMPTFPEIMATVMELANKNSSSAPGPLTSDTTTKTASSTTTTVPTSTKLTTTESTTTTTESTKTDSTTTESATTPTTTESAATPTTTESATTPTITESATTPTTTTPTITTSTTPTTTTTTEPTPSASTTTKPSTNEKTTTELTTTTKPPSKSPALEKQKASKPNKSTLPVEDPLIAEDVEELTTPSLPFEKPLATEFPEQSPFFPFPPFPRPRPGAPPAMPGFDICSNPWNFEEQPGETRTERLERQVVKLRCELSVSQRGTAQLASSVENELNDLKKLIYGMVSRMARLENVIRSSAFG